MDGDAPDEEAEANPEGSSRNLTKLDADKRHVSMPSEDAESVPPLPLHAIRG